jgi:ankyrin repeat protein
MTRPLLSKIKSQLSFRQRLPRSESKLVKLVLKQQWAEVLQFLADHGSSALGEDKGTASIHIRYGDFRQGNILHIMCEQHPPARVVHRVASLFPLLTAQVNAQKQTPLHVAAANGASHGVIATLLQKGGASSAVLQDFKGRTPLHAHVKCCTSDVRNCDSGDNDRRTSTSSSNNRRSCSSAGTAFSGGMISSSSSHHTCHVALSASSLVYGPNIKVLRLLAEAAPQTIHMVDHDGKSPMSMASSREQEEEHAMTSTIIRQNTMRGLSYKIASTVRRRSSLLFPDIGNGIGEEDYSDEDDCNDAVNTEIELDQDGALKQSARAMTMANTAWPSSRSLITQPSNSVRDMRYIPPVVQNTIVRV